MPSVHLFPETSFLTSVFHSASQAPHTEMEPFSLLLKSSAMSWRKAWGRKGFGRYLVSSLHINCPSHKARGPGPYPSSHLSLMVPVPNNNQTVISHQHATTSHTGFLMSLLSSEEPMPPLQPLFSDYHSQCFPCLLPPLLLPSWLCHPGWILLRAAGPTGVLYCDKSELCSHHATQNN